MRRTLTFAILSACLLTLTGCGGVQTFTNPKGPSAGVINGLWWTMVSVFGLAWLLTMVLIFVAIYWTHRSERPLSYRATRNMVFTGGFLVPAVAFFFLLIGSVFIGSVAEGKPSPSAINVAAIGHQWWWEFEYLKPDGSIDFVTADEMHIPVGRQVRVHIKSADVIHSFWIPNLAGKTDMIPGVENETWIQADEAGIYRGQCAEFCGTQHAHMAFLVIAEPQDAFYGWLDHSRTPAAEPTDPIAKHGQQVFLSASCVLCHTVGGTNAYGMIGPNLTHFASRHTIAAGTLPNTVGNLAGWIADPQRIKQGTRMATVGLDPGDIQPLVTYLESLK
jgi:cytochrome c oxidase subunit 2